MLHPDLKLWEAAFSEWVLGKVDGINWFINSYWEAVMTDKISDEKLIILHCNEKLYSDKIINKYNKIEFNVTKLKLHNIQSTWKEAATFIKILIAVKGWFVEMSMFLPTHQVCHITTPEGLSYDGASSAIEP